VIGYSKPIPEAGLPGETRLSPRDAYYYIIDDGMVDAQGRKPPTLVKKWRCLLFLDTLQVNYGKF